MRISLLDGTSRINHLHQLFQPAPLEGLLLQAVCSCSLVNILMPKKISLQALFFFIPVPLINDL
jgi:hypothetical protein